jgi:hypothetical protein
MQNANDRLYGVVEGVTLQQNERVEDLNERIAARQFPDQPLEPNYSPRSVPTKQSVFPIVERRKPATEELLNYPEYNVHTNFNPGSRAAPGKGFLDNINLESVLRNQQFSKQNCAQNVYIPTTKSDLYNVSVISRPSEQPYPLLFAQPQLETELHPNVVESNIGRDLFFNSTRAQLRNGL